MAKSKKIYRKGEYPWHVVADLIDAIPKVVKAIGMDSYRLFGKLIQLELKKRDLSENEIIYLKDQFIPRFIKMKNEGLDLKVSNYMKLKFREKLKEIN